MLQVKKGDHVWIVDRLGQGEEATVQGVGPRWINADGIRYSRETGEIDDPYPDVTLHVSRADYRESVGRALAWKDFVFDIAMENLVRRKHVSRTALSQARALLDVQYWVPGVEKPKPKRKGARKPKVKLNRGT